MIRFNGPALGAHLILRWLAPKVVDAGAAFGKLGQGLVQELIWNVEVP